ncbi:MAG TPA: hypothetical protein VI731_05725 [Bacteroidia bacterium]|nr:hypothetical protein [Bacteroidia bacterium]
MKTFFLPIIIGCLSLQARAQEHTPPDSTAVIKAKVHSAKIYYTGNGMKNHFIKEYRYDEKGRKVYEKEGNTGYYYAFYYNNKNQVIRSVQRTDDGKMIQAHEANYYPGGQRKEISLYYSGDSTLKNRYQLLDEEGHVIREINYLKGKPTRYVNLRYNNRGECTYLIDSTTTSGVSEKENQQLIRVSYYHGDTLYESWHFSYDSTGRVSESILKIPGKINAVYTINYYPVGQYKILLNGKESGTATADWTAKWNHLLPVIYHDEELPYSDPVEAPKYKHNYKRDLKGNILEDYIEPAYAWNHEKPVTYTYEYTYYGKK